MSKKPLVSIIIINYNGEKFLENCLNSIIKNTRLAFEVILIDNASSDKSLEILDKKFKSRSWLKVIAFPKNIGPASGRNVGVKNSRGQYLVFLDYDTRVGQNWLTKSIAYLTKQPKIGVAQLKILKMGTKHYDCAGEKLTEFGFLSERARGVEDAGQFDQVESIFSGKTAAMIVKRSVFNQAGGFDEDIFMYWEEPDFCWRVWKAGYQVIFFPLGKVWHAYGTSDKKITRSHAVWITHQGCRNHLMTIIKNASGLNLIKMILAVIATWVSLLIIFIFKFDWPRTQAVLRAFGWLATHPKLLISKRRRLKKTLKNKFYQDKKWLPKVMIKRNLLWYLGKGRYYLRGRAF